MLHNCLIRLADDASRTGMCKSGPGSPFYISL